MSDFEFYGLLLIFVVAFDPRPEWFERWKMRSWMSKIIRGIPLIGSAVVFTLDLEQMFLSSWWINPQKPAFFLVLAITPPAALAGAASLGNTLSYIGLTLKGISLDYWHNRKNRKIVRENPFLRQ